MNKFGIHRRPHTTTTWHDIRRMFKKHPVKTTLALPIAFVALGCQMILYYTTIPFVVFHHIVANV